jgi:hypothetical protein
MHRRIVSTVIGSAEPQAYLRCIGPREVSEMLSGDIAKYQIQDRIRAAEQDRASRSKHVDRDHARTAVVRKVGSGLLAAVVGRRRKATPTSSAVGIPLA